MANFSLRRRDFLVGAIAAAVSEQTALAATNYVVGALRWDAWHATGQPTATDGLVNAAVRADLGLPAWQSRMPWFGVPTSPNTVSIDGNQQAVMDAEITYAKGGGLNYWAYLWYGFSNPMMNAWHLHQKSPVKYNVNWCLMLPFSRLGNALTFGNLITSYVSYMMQTNYQRVLNARPLLFLFIDNLSPLRTNWAGSWANVRAALRSLCTACTSVGLSNPYIVLMYGDPTTAFSIMEQVSADAISNYTATVAKGHPAAYSTELTSNAAYWAALAATGAPIVPIVQMGWDNRPRLQTPPYFAQQLASADRLDYVAAGTREQIASNFQAAIRYVSKNPRSCPSRVILAYSWDECDEGGSTLIPTYTTGGPNHVILDAVGTVLNAN